MRILHLVVLAGWLAGAAGSPAQGVPTIQITSVPAYGSSGSLSGTVTGVNFATHKVAVYIQIEGAGWWTKPSFANPTVPIQPNGTFTASVTTGGLDDRATILCAVLIPNSVTPPVAGGSASFPAGLPSLALDHVERHPRVLDFAGRRWAVKESPDAVGPGDNRFSQHPGDVWVDGQGRLHLSIHHRSGQWWATEVILLESLGHGTYWFTTESELEDLDINATFGAFTWDEWGGSSVTGAPNREIDFEDSRWGNSSDPTTSQAVVQPYHVPGNLRRFTLPDLAGAPTLTRWFTWTPGQVEFVALRGRHSSCRVPPGTIFHWIYTHDPSINHLVPSAGRARMRFNLWLNSGSPLQPSGGQPLEVIVIDFRFTPEPRILSYGCYVNPVGSLHLLAGRPALGSTLVLGVHNPLASQAPGSATLLALSALPDPASPCGTQLGGWGMAGGNGEWLLALVPAPYFLGVGTPWPGGASPAAFALSIPVDPFLIGFSIYSQGILFDGTPGASVPLALTEALEICIGP